MSQKELNRAEWGDRENWGDGLFGVYFSKKDDRVWVPTRNPRRGWALNHAHRRAGSWRLGIWVVFSVVTISLHDPSVLHTDSPGVAGAAGGFVYYLARLNSGRIVRDKSLQKAFIDLAGGTLTGAYMHPLLGILLRPPVAAFIVGVSWALLVQQVRGLTTTVVMNTIGRGRSNGRRPGREGPREADPDDDETAQRI